MLPPMPRLLSLKTPDLISSVYLLGLIFLVLAARERITDWRWLLARYALLMVLQVAVAAGRGRGLPRILAAFFPLVPVLVIYDSLRFIPELNPGDRDDLLIWIDRAILGGDPSLWLARISTPWLTELLQILGGGILAALCVLLAPRFLRHEHPPRGDDRCRGTFYLTRRPHTCGTA